MKRLILLCLALLCAACSGMLPDSNKEPVVPWTSYGEAEAAFGRILPNRTTLPQLKALGFDPQRVPNMTILSHADLLRRLEAMVNFEGSKLDPAIRRCVDARQACFGYHIELQKIERERVGNFFLDFLNFKRVTNVRGWSVDALILISNNVVVYKSWSGKPNISEVEQERHPLGPLQGAGQSVR
ncbi:MAG TPA: hypothetical protein VFF16_13545 [Telluria sp.]|nr:hypothetical protein [Telluria sp.]